MPGPQTIDRLGFAAYCADAADAGAGLDLGQLLVLWRMSPEEVRVRWRLVADAVVMAHQAKTA